MRASTPSKTCVSRPEGMASGPKATLNANLAAAPKGVSENAAKSQEGSPYRPKPQEHRSAALACSLLSPKAALFWTSELPYYNRRGGERSAHK
jgi:threonine/homoserine/homoserine lactone efflux protein